MLSRYGLEFEGHEHSGIDDVKNLATIARRMWEDGAIFNVNRNLQENEPKKRRSRGKYYKRK
jgi:inhibitor of KinA sporulation pathway (predicted exonuclease)